MGSLDEVFENSDSTRRIKMNVVHGDKKYLEFPFEIERIASRKLRISHPYFNCSELNLVPLLLLISAAEGGEIASEDNMQTVIKSMLAQLINNDSPRAYDLLRQLPIADYVNFAVYDSRFSHLLKYDELFSNFSCRTLFISDIHDLTHHGLQTLLWPDFVEELGRFGKAALKNEDPALRHCAVFLLYACLEYSIITGSQGPYSAGCLNWQSPRKSPAEFSQYHPICGYCINQWNTLRGVIALYRRQVEVNRQMNATYTWFSQLGYALPKSIEKSIEQDTSLHHLTDFRTPYKFQAPVSIKELLQSGRMLMNAMGNNL